MVKTILDFVENSRLNDLQYSMTFLGIHGMSLEDMKKKDTFCALGVGMIKLLFMPNCSPSTTSFMDSVVILQRPLTNEYNNVVRLFCKSDWSVYKPVVMCKILMAVVVAFLCMPINSTFVDCDLLPLILIYITIGIVLYVVNRVSICGNLWNKIIILLI